MNYYPTKIKSWSLLFGSITDFLVVQSLTKFMPKLSSIPSLKQDMVAVLIYPTIQKQAHLN